LRVSSQVASENLHANQVGLWCETPDLSGAGSAVPKDIIRRAFLDAILGFYLKRGNEAASYPGVVGLDSGIYNRHTHASAACRGELI
jgi:hypothetical protein